MTRLEQLAWYQESYEEFGLFDGQRDADLLRAAQAVIDAVGQLLYQHDAEGNLVLYDEGLPLPLVDVNELLIALAAFRAAEAKEPT